MQFLKEKKIKEEKLLRKDLNRNLLRKAIKILVISLQFLWIMREKSK